MKIAIGSDHRGFILKEDLKDYIQKLGFDYKDFGTFSEEKSDYPDSAAEVSLKVSQGQYDRGILICASGSGMNIVANVITLGSKYVSTDVAKNIIELWLTTDYEAGRHDVRLNKLKQIENINFAE